MSTDWFVWAATAGSIWSTFWALAAWKRSSRPWSTYFWVNAAFSAAYSCAWGWLVVHPNTNRGTWSEAVTPFSVTSFWVVWAGVSMIWFFRNDPTAALPSVEPDEGDHSVESVIWFYRDDHHETKPPKSQA